MIENKDKIILDLCGGTGSWSKPYKDNGYTVINVTLPEYDVRLYIPPKNVYGILAAPPCTQFSFARTNAKIPRNFEVGVSTVSDCLNIVYQCQCKIKKDTQKTPPLKFWALENPNRGMLKWFLGRPIFVFNPYDFGDNYKKETALWGYFNIPKTAPINCNKPKFDKLKTKEIHSEYYGKLTRQERRAITPPGFAQSFYEANK